MMTADRSTDLRFLFDSLDRRVRPEDVAACALRVVGDRLEPDELAVVRRAARHAERAGYWSHMSDDWARPVDATVQVATLTSLLDAAGLGHLVPDGIDPADPVSVRALIGAVTVELAEQDTVACAGREARVERGVLSARRRDRLRRACAHLDAKTARLERALTRRRCAIVGRAGLVDGLTFDEFAADPPTAAFVAYYAARRNLRRQFTLSGKDNAFDDVAGALYAVASRSDTVAWPVVARVYGAPRVVERLSVAENMTFAALWWAEAATAAELARTCAGADRLHRDTMSVFRGLDSETWNLAAQAYNEARAAWFAAIDAAGALELVTLGVCLPKLGRVMAGDLVAWTLNSGGQRNPDTLVAASLPWPWEVFDGTATCTAGDVRDACVAAGVDADLSGWVGPRRARTASVFTPTRELVHGVVVGDPMLAALLRRAGVFSSKQVNWALVGELDGFVGGDGLTGR